MKYKLLKDLPNIKAGSILQDHSILNSAIESYSKFNDGWIINPKYANDYPDFFEPIIDKKAHDDLKSGEAIFEIDYTGGVVDECFTEENARSTTFLTREEAEDEHKRREWAVRKNKFFPKEGELYYTQWRDTGDIEKFKMTNDYIDNFIINSGLAFRSESECQDAIDNHDIIRLFYDVR